MENSRIISLMAKKAEKSAHPEELEELARLLAENPTLAYFHELVHTLKGNQGHLELVTPREEMVDHGWQDLAGRLNTRHAGGRVKWMGRKAQWVAAAIFLGVFLVASLLYVRRAPATVKEVQIETQVAVAGFGVKKQLVLSDGTRVWLNAG